jgi:hypothetical protein
LCDIRTRFCPFTWLFLLGLVLHGCAGTYSVVEFEVLEPATVSFPTDVSQLIILIRAPVTWDAFQKEDVEGLDSRQLIMLDSLIVKSLGRGLLEVLQQSPIEMFHHPLWASELRTDTASLDDMILTRREVDALCEKTGGNAVLSLESYFMDFSEETQYYSDDPTLVQTHYYEVSSKITWIIYLPGRPRPFDTYTMSDTIFFPEIIDGMFQEFFPTAQMIREAFHNSGMKYGRYLVPAWSEASRILFKGKGDSLKLASKYTHKGEWDKAYCIWEELALSGDSTVVSKALHNMAVYHELDDDLDSASLLVNRALEYDTLDAVRAYREELDIRILNRKEVMIQVR